MSAVRSNLRWAVPRARLGVPFGIGATAALLLGAVADDVSAAAPGGVLTTSGLILAVSAVLLLKAWHAHPLAGGVSTVLGMLALAAGAALLWRSRGTLRGTQALAPVLSGGDCRAAGCAQTVFLPNGVDRHALLSELRHRFIELQAAWDDNARDRLLGLTTPDMLEELCAARSVGLGAGNRTEVMSLDVRLVAYEELDAAQIVCAEFSGMIRESAASTAAPFRELWLLTRANDAAAGWRLARHQAML